MNNSKKLNTRVIAGCGVLIGVAVILQYIEFPIALMPSFIKLDLSDLPEIIGAFAYGPLAAVVITILKNVIHLLASQSGFVGELSNSLLGIAFVIPAGLIYQKNKTKKNAVIGGVAGALTMAIVSFPLNLYLIYPLYISVLHFPLEAIIGMYKAINPSVNSLAQALLVFNVPFTFLKGLADVILCTLVYKRISPLLKGVKK